MVLGKPAELSRIRSSSACFRLTWRPRSVPQTPTQSKGSRRCRYQARLQMALGKSAIAPPRPTRQSRRWPHVIRHCTKPGLKEISAKHQEVPPPDVISAQLRYIIGSDPLIELRVVPGDFDLVQYSLMDDNKKLKAASGRFKQFIDDARQKFGLIVLDCNPSSSFLTKISIENCNKKQEIPN